MSDRCDAGHKRTMRLNEDTVLVGRRCVLVPYKEKYVKRYHAWMQDDDLLALTASERLTLDEEVENQKSWRDDAKKLTFIVLDRAQCFKGDDRFPGSARVGDVNAFLTVPDEPRAAEGDVMVPERRRRGFGRSRRRAAQLQGEVEDGVVDGVRRVRRPYIIHSQPIDGRS